ncbi:Hydin, partial [Symbiodinium microadriaticum]
KPNKLSVNVKGEGYAVHPLIQLEHSGEVIEGVSDHYITLKPAPFVNYADFGVVQVLDTITKTFIVTNNGKYNFDYNWQTDVDDMEVNIDGAMMSFTVAGKYVYNIVAKGSGVQPAVRFSFMHHDFGSSFITSPGGNTVIEETILRIANHDPVNNIAVDCSFQKTRALWAECPPVVLEPGGAVDVPIRFAPRDVKEYVFVIPFLINGTGKINVNIRGDGILPRLELVNAAQRRINFGLVDVGSELVKTVTLVNRSIRALPVQLCEDESYGGSLLGDSCVAYAPRNEIIIQPRDRATIQLVFSPNRRIPQFTAQGAEVSLDTDSLPYGIVVLGSSKTKKLSLENTGDLSLTFQWSEASFGPHFSISPLYGKLAPGNEINFDVVFNPQFVDADIRQENIMLSIPGMSPLTVTCSGVCVPQPTDSIIYLHFDSLVRKTQTKAVNLQNPSEKDWFISPSISGAHWSVPNE